MSLRPMSAVAALVAALLVTLSAWSPAAAGPGSGARQLRVMSYNIRYDDGKASHPWADRLPLMAKLLHAVDPDLLGVQEALSGQMTDLADAMPGYARIGLGREGGDEGEHMGIFYRTDRLQVRESGNFWLSDTPEVPGSTSWGNHIPRMVTWALFKDRRTGQLFYHYNTQFDCDATCGTSNGNQVRMKSARLIAERTAKLRHPVILSGDFNAAAAASDPYRYLTAAGRFADTWQDAGRRGPIVGTYNDYGDPEVGGTRIDWMLRRGKINTVRSTIDTTGSTDGGYPSDHLPLVNDVIVGQPPHGPVPDRQAPGRVSGVTARTRANAVDLTWDQARDNIGVESYIIYGSNRPHFLRGRATRLSRQATLTFFDRGLAAGKTRYYQVVAVDRRGNHSRPSAVFGARTDDHAYLFEAEDEVSRAHSDVTVAAQANCCQLRWSAGHQLLVSGAAVGDAVSFPIKLPQKGRYQVAVDATKAGDFATWQASIDGQKVGDPVNAYAKTITLDSDLPLGSVDLSAGQHTVTLTAVDRDQASTNYRIGLDALVLSGS